MRSRASFRRKKFDTSFASAIHRLGEIYTEQDASGVVVNYLSKQLCSAAIRARTSGTWQPPRLRQGSSKELFGAAQPDLAPNTACLERPWTMPCWHQGLRIWLNSHLDRRS